jgi:hypothetical protein
MFPYVSASIEALASVLIYPSDTVGELKSAEVWVSYLPAWKAKKLGKVPQEKSTARTLK